MSESEDATMNPDDDIPVGPRGLELPSDLKAIDAALAALRPRADRLDRERLMFFAGRASASVAGERASHVLGLPVGHRAWPATFAGMTAVTIALLVLLVTRPATVEPRPRADTGIAAIEHSPSPEPSAMPQNHLRGRVGKMSTRDVYARDIEQLLAARDARTAEGSALMESVRIDAADRSILTPAAWQRVIDRTIARPSQNDSSQLPVFRGAES